jgi:hypothetical protein
VSARRRRRTQKAPSKAQAFWADNGYEPSPSPQIRPTSDPGALPRSLGDPPLAPAVSQHHLDAVYEEAVRAAIALAAANGLVAVDAGDGQEG